MLGGMASWYRVSCPMPPQVGWQLGWVDIQVGWRIGMASWVEWHHGMAPRVGWYHGMAS